MRELIIGPKDLGREYWLELWHYRNLLLVLTRRDIAVRYKQTAIGISWALIRPFLLMIIFTIVFGRLAKLASDGSAPYALMVFAAILPWTFFTTALSETSNSLVNNPNLIAKVYFPRLIIPAAAVTVAFVDFFISLIILVGLMIWYAYLPNWQIIFIPAFMAIAFATSLGLGLWTAALNVKYRDLRHAVPFFIQIGMYISPVGFSSQTVPQQWRLLYSLNPMVGVIDGFRWCILGDQSTLYLPGVFLGLAIAALLLFIGVRRFRKMEGAFADLI